MLKKDEVLTDPEATFREPRFLLEEEELSAAMKLKILRAWKHRITSYNVCYTKLLRSKIASCSIKLVIIWH